MKHSEIMNWAARAGHDINTLFVTNRLLVYVIVRSIISPFDIYIISYRTIVCIEKICNMRHFFYVPFVQMESYAAFSGKYVDREEGAVHLKFSV